MARVNSRGLVDDGGSGLTVAGSVAVGGQTTSQGYAHNAVTLTGTGVVTISQPGFYLVPATGSSGQGAFTGSVPAPGLFPGGMLIMAETFGVFDWLLSGSAYINGRALFCKMSGTLPGVAAGAGLAGAVMKMPPSGSVVMMSDGFRWCVIGGSGSIQISGNNA